LTVLPAGSSTAIRPAGDNWVIAGTLGTGAPAWDPGGWSPDSEVMVEAHERAGQPASDADLVDVAALVAAYYAEHPYPGEPGQRVAFCT
jgi:hypothetical protein